MKLYKVGSQFIMAGSHIEAIAASAAVVQAQAQINALSAAAQVHVNNAPGSVPIRDAKGHFVSKAVQAAATAAIKEYEKKGEQLLNSYSQAVAAKDAAFSQVVHRSHANRG